MKRTLLALAALLTLPAAASASHEVNVDVHIGGSRGGSGSCERSCGYQSCGHSVRSNETWVEFYPDRGAFVALYAAYSDGSVALVFPTSQWGSHWVEPQDDYAVPVWIPSGVRLESVQAVASRQWFDPAECYVAYAPRHDHRGRNEPRVTVVTASRGPLFTWNFSVAWGSSHHYEVVRSWGWEPERVSHVTWSAPRGPRGQKYKSHGNRGWDQKQKAQKRSGNHSVKVARTGRDEALPRTVRWTPGGRSSQTKKVKAAPGVKSSKSRKDSGEPKRRSRS